MLTYDLTQRGKMSLYEYLYEQIRQDILDGTIPGGTALPSKRAFAQQLGVSMITVENAYAQLQAEGYICSRPRRGFFAASADELALLRPFSHYSRTTGQKAAPGSEKPEVSWFADLSSNQTDPALFPFSIWARLTRQNLSERREELMKNAPAQGIRELRCAIADQLLAFRGMRTDPDQIIIGAGTEFLYGLLIQLLGFDKIYANEDPGYARPSAVFEAYGVKHVRVPLGEGGIDLQALERSGAQVVHITPAHHFPTGLVTGPQRRTELLDWAKKCPDRYLIEDDFDCEMPLRGHALRPIFAADENQHVIYMNTFTKSLAPTIRISYMVLPEKLAELYRAKLGFYSSPVPVFEQYVLGDFIQEGYFESHINRMRNTVRRKYALLLSCLSTEEAKAFFTVSGEQPGAQCLLLLQPGIRSGEFEEELERQKIRMRCLSAFFADPRSPEAAKRTHQYVISYAAVPLEQIEETAERILTAAKAAFRQTEILETGGRYE